MKNLRGPWRFDQLLVGPNTIDSYASVRTFGGDKSPGIMNDCELGNWVGA